MSGGKDQPKRGIARDRYGWVLAWYPPAWRRRYGAEFADLLADTYGRNGVPLGRRLALVRSGLSERLRESGLRGSGGPPAAGVEAGMLMVLRAWAICAVFGVWPVSATNEGPINARLLAASSHLAVGAAAAGGMCVLLGVLACAPALFRYLRAGGWREIRLRMLAVAVVTVACFLAERLRPPSTGGSWGNALLVVGGGLIFIVALVMWTFTAAAIVRRLDLSARVLRYCARLTLAVTVAMVAMTGGAVAWWAARVGASPWLLDTSRPLLMALMGAPFITLVFGAFGARRVLVARRRLS